MRAIAINEFGGNDKLKLMNLPEPKPKAGEVLIQLKAASLNHLDIWVRKGLFKIPFPHILGADGAGIIVEVGEGVNHLKVGEKVLISPGIGCGICQECASGRENFCKLYHILGVQKDGTYAEYVVLPAQNVLPIPPNLDFESAASVPLVFLTAWHALVTRGNIKPGMKVLIHAAGSGVGIAAIQIAKLFNAIVFTTAGSDTKLEKAKELGADVLINYKQEDFQERLKIETQGEGIDLILDHVGFDTVMKGLKSLKKGGKLITLGATSGSEVPIELRFVYGKNLSIEGIYMGSKAELMEVLKFFQNGKLKPVIHTVLPLEEAQEAHRILENREAFGKVVLKI
ncbi:NADPH:quinone reductase [Candidatus Kryptonium thompsonii]|uniref:NADPH:quinone reductase n=2 Tax=Candidatus Kryptonium thompsonii TaxID=1633631 RepID=A0A0P1M6J1_9BACT|nr:zinc-binding dehydrogenase [Candidatus Kryptonium thompsoni]CUS81015.1 NADPH:quinone reductase [Candidatus Kryptonium thompsoni]CUS87483.1 NADPH:quinone reductase [Candidatus Kryptonium thompsoni]CUS89682.1 NADPH:quinone reductase [Candidatus Kryptonium thompsoni]CUS90608.1 NADPH:quinone reductase [Candidatus Kryptonium thompsoni]CUS93134.1 NADPH:quinone reductase [Candidatus Kryptonium thompsoni]